MNKLTKKIIVILSVLSLLIGVVVGVSRSYVEEQRRNFQVAIKYTDVLAISNLLGEPLEDVLVRFKEAGVNALFVRENTVMPESNSDLSNYKAQGKATYYEGYMLKNFYPEANNIQPQSIYIEVLDQIAEDNIYNHFNQKNIKVNRVTIQDKTFLETKESPHILATVGVGFNEEDLALAASLGYTILPQIKSWTGPTQESISYIVSELERIPNLGTIYFSDSEVVGVDSADMIQILRENGLGFVEFFSDKQKGFATLAKKSRDKEKNYNVIRLHTLADGEVNTYDEQRLMERYMLALRERNISSFLFKIPTKGSVKENETELISNIKEFVTQASKKEYTQSNDIKGYNLPSLNYWGVLCIGLAVFGIFILLCDQLTLAKLGIILSIIGFIGYGLILKKNFILGSQLIALFGSICFPIYATVKGIVISEKGMKGAIRALLTTFCVSVGGVLLIVGVISGTGFGLGIELFRGVKAAFLLPILGSLIIIIYKYHNFTIKEVEKWIRKPITYGTIIILGVLALVMLVYIMKSGNSGQKFELEMQFRQLLNNVLGVRPRTKEFLIGYPVIMIIGYYGYKEFYWPLAILATVGQISLINTYTHVHTPLMISIIRSVYGLVGGIIVGIVSIYIIDWIVSLIKTKFIKQ